ncbi:MAG: hypothetical protein IID41_14460 [Planctomycetes bacterium]|nr:hypothetical protein [Planctomycetota bacterium]
MKNVANATAASVSVRIGGESYIMRPWTWDDFGTMKNWMRERALEHMYSEQIENLPPADRIAIRQSIAEKASEVNVPATLLITSPAYDRSMQIFTSVEGIVMMFWLSFLHEHPGLELETVQKWLDDPKIFDYLSDLYDRLNSDGKKKKTTRAKEKAGKKKKKKPSR